MTNTDGSNMKRNCWVSGLHKIFASAEDLATCTVVDAYKDQVNEYTVIYVVCDSQDEAIFGNEYKTGTKWIIANKTIFGGNSIAQVESYIVGVGSSYSWGENSFNVSTSESILNYNIKKGAVLKFPDNVLRRVNNIDGTTFTVDKKLTTTDSSATLYKLYGISYGAYSCARGEGSTASGHYSNAEGSETIAYGVGSHAEGRFTKTSCNAEHAQGSYNVSHKATDNFDNNAGNTLHSIGIGTDENTQSNAVEVMQNGDVYIKGVGGYDGVHIKSEAGYETVKTLQQVINGKQDTLTAGQNIVITNNTISAVIDAGFQVEVVQTLPTTGEANTIYFISKEGGANPDVYDEYMYINNAWEKIGSTEVDLSNYYNKTEVDTLLSGKQDKLTAGNNIIINGNTISANDTTYSAGANIDITDNAIKAVGYRYNTTNGAFAEGDRDIVDGDTTRSKPTATGVMSHAEGSNTKAIGRSSHVEGNGGSATGIQSHAEGSEGNAIGINSHVEGRQSIANGYASHAEGYSEAGGNYASATSNTKTAGTNTSAGAYAHSEGNATIAYGIGAHAEGLKTLAKGNASHSEGYNTIANGTYSHTEGSATVANGSNSHAEGRFTQTFQNVEHAQGSYNKSHTDKTKDGFGTNGSRTIHSIGIGTAEDARKNAVEVMQNGDAYLLGVGNYDGVHIKGETGYETVQTLQEVVSGKQDALIEGQNIHIADDNTISAVIDAGFSVEVVTALPTTGKTNTIYFVPISGGGTDNSHDEYMYIKNKWEKIGNTSVDLSNYYNKTETDNLLSNKQATLTAGNNITIDGNTIAAKGYRYDASTGAFAEGDRDIVYSGTTYDKPSATGVMAHAEGSNTKAIGRSSHAEGNGGSAGGENSHVEGHITYAHSQGGHAEGRYTYAYGGGAHAEGNSVIVGHGYENINGDTRYAYGGHGEGLDVVVVGMRAHGEGQGVMAAGNSSHAEGDGTEGVDYWKDFSSGSVLTVKANEDWATISKLDVLKSGSTLSSLKVDDIITYNAVYVRITLIFPIVDSTEYQLKLNRKWYGPDMSIDISTLNSGPNVKFFVFRSSVALGSASHIEGKHNKSIGVASHAEGSFTVASGDNSHSGGEGTIAQGNNQTAIGKYNISDSDSLFIVGNGTSSVRSNAMKLDASGNLSLAGRFMGDDGDTHIGAPLNNNFIYLDEDTRCEHSIMGDNDGVTWKITNTGTGTGFDSITASSGFFQSSDIRKKNILGDMDLDKAYNLIDKCQTILYSLKDDESSKEQIGLIAQEVQEFFPEIVSVDEDGFLSLDYARLTVIILKVLKDLIPRVSKLEGKGYEGQ